MTLHGGEVTNEVALTLVVGAACLAIVAVIWLAYLKYFAKSGPREVKLSPSQRLLATQARKAQNRRGKKR